METQWANVLSTEIDSTRVGKVTLNAGFGRNDSSISHKLEAYATSDRNASNISGKIHRYVLRNSLIRSASFVRSLDFACVIDTLQPSTCRKFPTSLAKLHWGMCFGRGRYRHF